MSMSAGGGGTTPNINVTPLIDVLLVLLIIFMVITPLKPARFKAMVPQPPPDIPPQDVKANPYTLIVTIDSDAKIKLNQDDMGVTEDTGKLGKTLSDIFRDRTEKHAYSPDMETRTDLPEAKRIAKSVFIKAPKAIKYGEVVKVIDAVKGAGAEPVGLQIDQLQ